MKIFMQSLMALAILVSSSTAIAQPKSNVPQFAQYPVASGYTAQPAKLILATEQARMFRTRLRNAMHQPVNFAGKFVLTTWGCGSGCTEGAAVSLKSGAVVFLPGAIHRPAFSEREPLRFCINSRLLIMTGYLNEEGENAAYYYELTGNEFRHIKTVPVKRHVE